MVAVSPAALPAGQSETQDKISFYLFTSSLIKIILTVSVQVLVGVFCSVVVEVWKDKRINIYLAFYQSILTWVHVFTSAKSSGALHTKWGSSEQSWFGYWCQLQLMTRLERKFCCPNRFQTSLLYRSTFLRLQALQKTLQTWHTIF